MKILLINNVHYNRGGADKVYLNTGKLLEEHGHEISYFAINHPENFDSEFSKYFIRNPDFKNKTLLSKLYSFPRYYFSTEAQHNLQCLINNYKPEIAHIHLLYGGGLTSSILPVLKKNKIPIVLTIHDYKLLCPVLTLMDNNFNICEKCANGNYIYCISKRCNQITLSSKTNLFNSLIFATESWFRDILFNPNKFISKYIYVSEFSKIIHNKYKPYLIDKSEILFNFIDFSDSEIPSFFMGDYFLYFGRLSREKGLLTILESFRNYPQSRLLIIGDGSLRNEIQAYITNFKLNNVSLLGYMKGDKLNSYINNSKFVILASQWYENNPLSVIESFRFGKPVLGANIGGIPELIKDGETGFLFDPRSLNSLNNALLRAQSTSTEEYIKLSQNAYRFACDNFQAETHYLKLIKIYNSIF